MIPDRLDDDLLAAYASGFYGYGTYAAPYWFVGMEEGGGSDIANLRARLRAWQAGGQRELEDLPRYSVAIGEGRWFGERPRLQSTWGRQIRMLLAAEGRAATTETVRRYQAERLGRLDGESAVVELLPLPSPSIGHWHYGAWSSLPTLRDRAAYLEHYAPRRAEHLRRRIEEYRPADVVFAGLDGRYQPWWKAISGVPMERREVEGQTVRAGSDAHTLFVVTPHPVAWGLTNAFFHCVGTTIADVRGSS